MRELLQKGVVIFGHPYNIISHKKTGMFGLAQKLVMKCHNRLESTLYNRQGVTCIYKPLQKYTQYLKDEEKVCETSK